MKCACIAGGGIVFTSFIAKIESARYHHEERDVLPRQHIVQCLKPFLRQMLYTILLE